MALRKQTTSRDVRPVPGRGDPHTPRRDFPKCLRSHMWLESRRRFFSGVRRRRGLLLTSRLEGRDPHNLASKTPRGIPDPPPSSPSSFRSLTPPFSCFFPHRLRGARDALGLARVPIDLDDDDDDEYDGRRDATPQRAAPRGDPRASGFGDVKDFPRDPADDSDDGALDASQKHAVDADLNAITADLRKQVRP